MLRMSTLTRIVANSVAFEQSGELVANWHASRSGRLWLGAVFELRGVERSLIYRPWANDSQVATIR